MVSDTPAGDGKTSNLFFQCNAGQATPQKRNVNDFFKLRSLSVMEVLVQVICRLKSDGLYLPHTSLPPMS
jgi:hypothetical protein